MARAAGIEITDTEVRIAEIDGSDRKYKVLGAATIPIEPDDSGERSSSQIGAAARQAFKTIRAKKEQIVLGLPAREAVIREIVIPFTEPEQIKKVIKFESESHLPASNIDDVIVGFYKVSETGPRSRLLIFAVKKDTLRKHLDALGSAGIEPTQIDLSATALYGLTRLVPDLASEDPDDTTVNLILDLGQITTTVMVTQGPTLRMVRSMRLGTDTLTRTLSHDLGIGREEAATVTQSILRIDSPFATAGEVEAKEPTTALTAVELKQDIIRDKETEFAKRIVAEVRRTLSSVHVEGRVQGFWLTGPASTAPGLERELREAFGVAVRPLDVLAGAEHRVSPEAALYSGPSIGLALKALEHDPVGLEFRQEEFAYARKFDRVRNPLLFASALILVLFAFLAIIELKRIDSIQKDVTFCAQQGQSEFSRLVVDAARKPGFLKYMKYADAADAEAAVQRISRGKPESQIRAMLREIADVSTDITERYGISFEEDGNKQPEEIATSALIRLEAWAEVMNELSIKQKILWKIDKLSISETKITWTWRVPRDQVADARNFVFDRFKSIKDFSNYKPGGQKSLGQESEISNSSLEFVRGY